MYPVYTVLTLVVGLFMTTIYADTELSRQPIKNISNEKAQVHAVPGIAVSADRSGQLELQFPPAKEEQDIRQYRVIIVPDVHALSFGPANLGNLSPQIGKRIRPNGQGGELKISTDWKDFNGDNLETGIAYRAFILSEAWSGNPSNNKLSQPSRIFEISSDLAENGRFRSKWLAELF